MPNYFSIPIADRISAAQAHAPRMSSVPEAAHIYQVFEAGKLEAPDHFSPRSGRVYVRDADELYDLIPAVAEHIGRQMKDPDTYVDRVVKHERSHALAARMLGARGSLFGVRFERVPNSAAPGTEQLKFTPFHRVIGFRGSRLAYALIAGYPLEPSVHDHAAVRRYGFESVQALGERAVRINATRGNGEPKLPVPMSFSLAAMRTGT